MRLLIVSQHFWPENFRINDLTEALSSRGHTITVLTGKPNYPDGDIYPEFKSHEKEFGEFHGVQLVRVPIIPRGRNKLLLVLNFVSFALSASALGGWRLRRRDFDVIFVFAPSPISVAIPAIFLRWCKHTPLACWVLDLWPETLQAVGVLRRGVLLSAVATMVRFIYRRCDLILVQSLSFIPQVARYCDKQRRISYLPNWAEPAFTESASVPAPEVPLDPTKFSVMFAGNIGVAQDFPSVLSAAEKLSGYTHIRWLIVGDGRMAPWLRAEVARRNLQSSVFLLGQYPMDRMPSFYRHASALLVCLRDEPAFAMTIPGKLQSYFAAGTPVLAMLNGEGAELVRRTNSGIACAAGDAEALAAAVLQLASMSTVERAELGRNARRTSEQEFERNLLVSRLESWLSELASISSGTAASPPV